MNQRKCSNCGHWNDQSLRQCKQCEALIDPVELAEKAISKAKEQREAEAKANAGRFEKWIDQFRESPKPLNRFLYKVLSVIFTIHMAIMSFFIWLIALISG